MSMPKNMFHPSEVSPMACLLAIILATLMPELA